jgi:tRNA-dihydrouridine synthase B
MRIGSLQFDKLIALAPMENVTNTAFRIICKRLGADLVYTEFTSCEALIRHIPKATKKILLSPEERPAAIQIFGSQVSSIVEAIRVAESFNPDLIDINCGCWNKNHALRGEGAGLLLDLPRMERILSAAVKSTAIPITVKTRLGWDEKDINILTVAQMVEQTGCQALTVHCRTRCQGYKGQADWQWLEKIKSSITIPLIGNGDIRSAQDVKQMFATGCDGVMIGRAAVANPWIFQQAKHFLQTGLIPEPPTISEKVAVCIEHLKQSIQCKGMPYGLITFRKYYAGYFHGFAFCSRLRSELVLLNDLDAIIEKLQNFANNIENALSDS